MSTPQTEDGYTRIANELLDAIISFDFSKRQYAVVFAVIRMTYGYNKKADALSIWQIANMTNIDRSHVSKAVAELVGMNVLTKSENGRMAHGQIVPEISLNKIYKNWITDAKTAQVSTDAETATHTDADSAPVPKQHQCQNSPQTDAETATPPVPKQHTHKDIPKDIPKDSKNNSAHAERKQSFFPDDFPAQLQSDFEKLRKAKRAPITQSAMDGLVAEAAKANITLEAAIRICCQRGWQGFDASWLDNSKSNQSRASPANSKEAGRQAAARSIFKDEHIGHLNGVNQNEHAIDAEFTRL